MILQDSDAFFWQTNSSEVCTCFVHINWSERSGSLSVFWFLHVYWTMNSPGFAVVSHSLSRICPIPLLRNFVFLLCGGGRVFSRIHCTLPKVWEETMVLFILRDYAYTSRDRGTSESLALSWNIPQLPPVSIWSTTWACTNLPSSCPVLCWTETGLLQPKGSQTSPCLWDQVPRALREGCRQKDWTHGFFSSLEIWVPKPTYSLWIQY